MKAQSPLNSSACVSKVVDNLPAMVAGRSVWEMPGHKMCHPYCMLRRM